MNQNMYFSQFANPKQPVLSSTFPVHPDVRFRRLPFFDILGKINMNNSNIFIY